MSREQAFIALETMLGIYHRELSVMDMDTYIEAWSSLDENDLMNAIVWHAVYRKHFPTVKQIIEHALALPHERTQTYCAKHSAQTWRATS
jgi:hypothetical protein